MTFCGKTALCVSVLGLSCIADHSQAQRTSLDPYDRLIGADENYSPKEVGDYARVRNRDGALYNFRIKNLADGWSTIPMGDPTIMEYDGWFYVTGTSDGCRDANFAIYKSKDLVKWEPHMTAFVETTPGGVGGKYPGRSYNTGTTAPDEMTTLTWPYHAPVNGTSAYATLPPGGGSYVFPRMADRRNHPVPDSGEIYTQMWAPQLYRVTNDPDYGDAVLIAFSAVMTSASDWPSANQVFTPLNSSCQPTALVSYIPLTEFVNRTGHFRRPQTFIPTSDSSGTTDFRAGKGLTGGIGLANTVPSTGNFEMTPIGTASGDLAVQVCAPVTNCCNYYNFKDMDPIGRGWMTQDPFFYQEAGIKYVLYSHPWFYAGAVPNIASTMYPLTRSSSNWGRRWHHTRGEDHGNFITVGDPTTIPTVAEAGAAVRYNSKSYFFFSRNSTRSAGYEMRYRVGADIQNVGATEQVVLRSADQSRNCGVSFGSGEVFMLNGKPYVIFHQKEDGISAISEEDKYTSTSTAYPTIGYTGRTVFFKELYFDEFGELTMHNDNLTSATSGRIRNDTTVPKMDIDVFLVPSERVQWECHCSGDINCDGDVGTDADIEAFFRVLAGGACQP